MEGFICIGKEDKFRLNNMQEKKWKILLLYYLDISSNI